jgi:hypothetical protein
MKKVVLALGLLAAVALAVPGRAEAHFSLAIGLPGFGFFFGAPTPPVVYAPPPVVYAAPAPVYAAPVPFYPPAVVYAAPSVRFAYGHPYYRHGWYGRR